MAQTAAQIIHDLVVQTLATAGPALRAGELLDTTAQSLEADDLRRSIQLSPQFVAQAREEGELEAFAGFAGKRAEVGLADPAWRWPALFGTDRNAKPAQHCGQSRGEF